jgi:septal ring factor EnvC (AmiA/AmiB activator)
MHPLPILLALAALAQPSQGYEAIRKRLAQDRVRMQFLQREEASILRGLFDLERGIEEKQRSILELAALCERIEKKIEALDGKILANDEEIARLRLFAGRRAAAMHRLRRTSIASILARVKDQNQARRLRDRLRFVLAYDADLIGAARSASDEDQRLKAELRGEKERFIELSAGLAEETEESLVLKAERAALLEAVRSEKATYQRLGRELKSAAKRLEKELTQLRGGEQAPEPAEGGFDAQKGRLPWPVSGRVEMTFGKKVEPESGMIMVSKGLDLRAPQSAEIRAVFGGTVAYANTIEGYGRLVILDHGGGWYTLYAHCEALTVRAGQSVNQHQVIGFVGDSGSTKGAYLYFEIRQGKKPIDPLEWLAK